MDYRYSRFDPLLQALKDLLRRLMAIFNYLILQTDGDVEEALEHLERFGKRYGFFNERFTIEDFKKYLQKEQIVEKILQGSLRLTRKGEQVIRKSSLEAIFTSLRLDPAGEHRVPAPGLGNERLTETRPYQFGDPVSLIDSIGTIANAVRRGGIDSIDLEEEDFQVHETEHTSSCATVLMLDISHSMILYGEDRITPAKRVALALCELIETRYPKDSLEVVLFGDTAWQVPAEQIPYVSVGPFHTNTRAGLQLAQQLLRKKKQNNRQIFMITDGKPSALTEPDGTIYKNPFGLDRRVVAKTLDEAANCRRLGIPITTFMLTDEPPLVEFVQRFTKVNRGRAYYSQPDQLGSFVFVDYIRNRRRRVR
ncbi:MAG: hypothetical protein HY717_16270 [Planctomycetes bacterium]|nr:hypothetical protein [Planctomycetota bacterium]